LLPRKPATLVVGGRGGGGGGTKRWEKGKIVGERVSTGQPKCIEVNALIEKAGGDGLQMV